MDFRIDCACGRSLTVTEGSAGAILTCDCGQPIRIPRLKDLRLQAGLAAYDPSPELVIEQYLARQDVPSHGACVRCAEETDQLVRVVTTCERQWVKGAPGIGSWLIVLFLMLVSPLAGLWWGFWRLDPDQSGGEPRGSDKIYRLPLFVCRSCRPAVRGSSAIKKYLREIPTYRKLLEKFPDAQVSIEKP
jgi:hypothetical protein